MDTWYDLAHLRLESTRKQRERFLRRQQVERMHAMASSTHTRQWKMLCDRDNMQIYRQEKRARYATGIMGYGKLAGSLDDVFSGLYAETTRESRLLDQFLSDRIVDSAVIHVDQTLREESPIRFAGLHWMAIDVVDGVSKQRDFCAFKCMGVYRDDEDQEIGYLVVHSIDPAVYHVLQDPRIVGSRNRVRAHASLAWLFKPVGEDLVEVFLHGEYNMGSPTTVPSLMDHFADMAFAESCLAISAVCRASEAKKLYKLTLKSATQRSKEVRRKEKKCSICYRQAGLWAKLRTCRACCRLVCGQCRMDKLILPSRSLCPSESTTHHAYTSIEVPGRTKPLVELFCLACVASVSPSSSKVHIGLIQQRAKRRRKASMRWSDGPQMHTAGPDQTVNLSEVRRLESTSKSISTKSTDECSSLQLHLGSHDSDGCLSWHDPSL